MTHGYQFEDWDIHHFINSPWWSIFLGLTNDIKTALNKYWFKWTTNRNNFDFESFSFFLKSRGLKLANIKNRTIEEFIQNEIYKKVERFCENAVELLNEKNLLPITHVIFGHTHDFLQVKYEDLLILNTGCWLSKKQAYFVEILANGYYSIKCINS